MTIQTNRNEGELTLILEGRLDTITAPQLEEALNGALENVSKLTLDFSGLEYISSAGLRVLLAAHKAVKAIGADMTIRQPNESIAEVFEITGFSEILTLE